MSIAYIGRQAVFTSELEPAAYELLFRSSHENRAHITDPQRSTAEVMLCAVVDIGLPQLTGSLPALINMPRQSLLGGHAYILPHDHVVLEVLEDVEPDQVVIDALSALKSDGYAIALDDFVYSPHLLPLVALADIVKVEFPAVSRDQLRDHVEVLRQYEVRLLAEKIETHEEFEFCRELGFDLYQGFFFCKPKVITGDRIPANRLALLRLISRLNNPEVSLADVAEVIHKEPSLSYRLFRFANSAFCSTSAPIESLSHAVAIAGLERVAAFASLSLLTKALDTQSLPLISTALTRAKMCEILAAKSSQRADALFVIGLFSTLDALLNKPLEKVLDFVSLPADLRAALLTGSGSMGAILTCVLEYEKGNWEHVNCPGLDHRDIFAAYLEAINWAGNVADEVASVESLEIQWRQQARLVDREAELLHVIEGDRCVVAYWLTDTDVLVTLNHLARGNAPLQRDHEKTLRMWAALQLLPVVAIGDFNFDYSFVTQTGNESFAEILKDGTWKWVRPNPVIDTNWADHDGKESGTMWRVGSNSLSMPQSWKPLLPPGNARLLLLFDTLHSPPESEIGFRLERISKSLSPEGKGWTCDYRF